MILLLLELAHVNQITRGYIRHEGLCLKPDFLPVDRIQDGMNVGVRAYMAQKIVNHALADAHYRMVGIQPGQLRCLTPLHRIPEVVLD